MATWVVWANSQSATFFFTRHSLVRAKSEVFVLLYVLFCLSTISRQPAYSRQILHVGVLWFRMCLLPFWGLAAPGGWKKGEMKFSLLWESMGNFCSLAVFERYLSNAWTDPHQILFMLGQCLPTCHPPPVGSIGPWGAGEEELKTQKIGGWSHSCIGQLPFLFFSATPNVVQYVGHRPAHILA